jgi:hypothetical protein
MPIRINLLAEALAEEDLRRRDPVKRAIFGGAFLVALSLVWFSSTWLEYMVEKESLNRIEGQIQVHTNDYAQVQSNLKRYNEVQQRLDDLEALAAARFLQGNLMNGLQQAYVPNVQITRLRVDQTYSASAAVPPRTNNYGVVPGRPPSVTQHIMLTMDAKDNSPNPGDQMNRFKDAIAKQDYFSRFLDATNGVRLSNLSPIQTPLDGKPFVMFTLECRFEDKTP